MATKKAASKNEITPGSKPVKEMLTAVMSAKKDLSKYSAFMSAQENPNRILKNTGDGKKKGYELFREMMTDPQIAADMGTRQKMVSGLTWKIVVPGGTEQDNENANLLEEMLRPVYEDLLTEMQDDLVIGFSVTELNWEYNDGKLTLPSVLGHKQEDFTFSPEWELKLKTGNKDVPVSRDRVCLSVFNKKKGNLFGEALLTGAFWPWWFKKHAWLFWSTFLEKFGQPTVAGYFPPGTEKSEQDLLLQACQSVQNEMSIILPENWKIDLIEAQRSGAVDTYEKFLKYCDMGISKVILHTAMTSNATQYGTQGLGEVQQDLTSQVVESDARRYSGNITQQVVKPLGMRNYNFSVPPLFMIVYQTEDTSKESAEKDKTLSETVPVAVDDIYDKYKLTKPGPDTIVSYR
jgi:phage gp29-like protein